MTTFAFTTGNPADLTGGSNASMTDIQGSFTDLRTFLNGGNIDDTNLNAGNITSFLKLVTTGQRKVNWGSSTVNFSGTTLGDTPSIAHGLGVVPVFAIFIFSYTGNTGLNVYLKSSDATNIVFHGVATAAITSTGGNWLAIG